VGSSRYSTSYCCLATGPCDGSVRDLLVHFLKEGPRPLLLWCEPVNGPVRLQTHVGLMLPEYWQDGRNLRLSEAHLFYDKGLLHIATRAGQTRWAAWREVDRPEAAAIPWCPDPAERLPVRQYLRHMRPVLLNSEGAARQGSQKGKGNAQTEDIERGLRKAIVPTDRAFAYEYYERGVPRWWRLELT